MHAGSRFRYTYYDKSHGPIHSSIENLDKMVFCGLTGNFYVCVEYFRAWLK